MKGNFTFDESGMLLFSPNKKYSKILPEYGHGAMIGFSNQTYAISELGFNEILNKVDLSRVCGVNVTATILIKGLTVGDGPSRKWYTTEFLKFSSKSKASLTPCAHG